MELHRLLGSRKYIHKQFSKEINPDCHFVLSLTDSKDSVYCSGSTFSLPRRRDGTRTKITFAKIFKCQFTLQTRQRPSMGNSQISSEEDKNRTILNSFYLRLKIVNKEDGN